MKRGNAETKAFFEGNIQRRQFFKFAGASALTVGLLGCKKENKDNAGTPYVNTDNTIDFKEDGGLLNYIYALEQLEAAFYIKAVASLPATFTPTQVLFFTDIKLHEIAHREFFKNFLGQAGIGALEFDFSAVNFTDAATVFTYAKIFEDLGVAAYNDVIVRSKNDYNLIIFSQIATVEARHAAYVRSQLDANSFADFTQIDNFGADATNALDVSLSPDQVLAKVSLFIKTKLNVINL